MRKSHPLALTSLLFLAHYAIAQNNCVISNSEECSLSALRNPRTFVFPPNAQCIVSTVEGLPNPYSFQVSPGSNSKILIFFQGGGFCVQPSECIGVDNPRGRLTPNGAARGIMDNESSENPFRTWTKVVVSYCSGDAHVGTRSPYHGVDNVQAVLNWVDSNVIPNPTHVAIAGYSAGGMGAMYWSRHILQRYASTSTKAMVMFDAWAGLNGRNDYQVAVADSWNGCGSALMLGAPEEDSCRGGSLPVIEFLRSTMQMYPSVPFLFVNFFVDGVQRDLYCGRSCTSLEHYQDIQTLFIESFIRRSTGNALFAWLPGEGHGILHQRQLFQSDNLANLIRAMENGDSSLTSLCESSGSFTCDALLRTTFANADPPSVGPIPARTTQPSARPTNQPVTSTPSMAPTTQPSTTSSPSMTLTFQPTIVPSKTPVAQTSSSSPLVQSPMPTVQQTMATPVDPAVTETSGGSRSSNFALLFWCPGWMAPAMKLMLDV